MKFAYLFMSVLSLVVLSAFTHAQTIEVDATYPSASTHSQSITLIGTVESAQDAFLAPLQEGLVAQIMVEKGTLVQEGQALLSLDSELAALNLKSAEAAVLAAQTNAQEAQRLYDEVTKLAQQQFVAETLIAQRRANAATTQSMLQQAMADKELQQSILNRHTLKAPFSGLITQRMINVGEWASRQNPLFQLVSLNQLRASVEIPQEYYLSLSNAIKVDNDSIQVLVRQELDSNISINATLDVMVASANKNSRTLTALVELPSDGMWLVGMPVQAELSIPNTEQDIVWLPKTAIKQHPDGGTSVFTITNDLAQQRTVKIIKSNKDNVAVSGVSPEHMVVTSGVAVIKNGANLKVKNLSKASV